MRNAIDRIKLRQASRLVAKGGCVAKEQLLCITESDIRQSRVFRGGSDLELGDDACNEPDVRREGRRDD